MTAKELKTILDDVPDDWIVMSNIEGSTLVNDEVTNYNFHPDDKQIVLIWS